MRRIPRDGFFSDMGPIRVTYTCPACESNELWIDDGYVCRKCRKRFTVPQVLGRFPSDACKHGLHDQCNFGFLCCACECHKNDVRWVKCKGCGKLVALFTKDAPPYYVKGAVGHSKPAEFVNVPGTVQCELYKRLSTREFFDLHQDAEPVEKPERFEPVES